MKLDVLVETVTHYAGAAAALLLRGAFQIAEEAHQGFTRRTDEPYISHPLAVAGTLASWQAPATVVSVGLLHDILNPNYSIYSYERVLDRVRGALGQEALQLLQAVLQLNRFTTHFRTTPQANSANTNRVQSTHGLSLYQQERTAATTLEVYSPLANRLGMRQVKRQFDDLSLAILYPHIWSRLQAQYQTVRGALEIGHVIDALRQRVAAERPRSQIRWQPSHFYGLYCRYGERYPLQLAPVETGCCVVTVEKASDCYHVLGVIHEYYKPVAGAFRDLIAADLENGYRALHTQVTYQPGPPLDVVIRAADTELVAEWGVTAQWRGVTQGLPRLPYAPKMKSGEIMVFTPRGDAIYLPEGATAVDFAYAIHSDVGHRCVRAEVNGELVPLHQPLQTGDRVEITLGGPGTEPSRYWLEFVKTDTARRLIQKHVAQRNRDSMVEKGRSLLTKRLQPLGLSVEDTTVVQWLGRLVSQRGFRSLDDLLASIGAGWLKASTLVKQFRSGASLVSAQPAFNVVILSAPEAALPRQLAGCCSPGPSDSIVGYRRNDNTISIHNHACNQLKSRDRLLQVEWDNLTIKPVFEVEIEAWNRPGLVRDLSDVIVRQQWDMGYFHAAKRPDGTATAHFSLENVSLTQLHSVLAELRALPGVRQVKHDDSVRAGKTLDPNPRRHVPNPYGPSPVTGKQFYGREHEQRVIINHLRNPHRNTAILLWGQRRIGKTSLLIPPLRYASGCLYHCPGRYGGSSRRTMYGVLVPVDAHH